MKPSKTNRPRAVGRVLLTATFGALVMFASTAAAGPPTPPPPPGHRTAVAPVPPVPPVPPGHRTAVAPTPPVPPAPPGQAVAAPTPPTPPTPPTIVARRSRRGPSIVMAPPAPPAPPIPVVAAVPPVPPVPPPPPVVAFRHGGKKHKHKHDFESFAVTFSSSRGRLGVHVSSMTPELRKFFGAPDDAGMLVQRVKSGGAGEKAGIQVGDVLVEVDGDETEDATDVMAALAEHGEGTEVQVVVIRKKKKKKLKLKLQDDAFPGISIALPSGNDLTAGLGLGGDADVDLHELAQTLQELSVRIEALETGKPKKPPKKAVKKATKKAKKKAKKAKK